MMELPVFAPMGITATYVVPPPADAPPGTFTYVGQPEIMQVDFTFDHLHQLLRDVPLICTQCLMSRDRRTVMLAAAYNAQRFDIVRPEFQDDEEVVLRGLENDINPFLFCTPRVRNIREVVMAALRQDGQVLFGWVPEEYLADTAIVALAIRSWPPVYQRGLPRQCLANEGDRVFYENVWMEALDAQAAEDAEDRAVAKGKGKGKFHRNDQDGDDHEWSVRGFYP